MTLVELLVAMAIFATIMSGVMIMFASVTGTVRRSYRTMDIFEATQGALMAIERDVQTAFASPVTGDDFNFYGEPNGFIMVGIDHDGDLGRLTYAVHVDTSRMQNPGMPHWRGELMTVPLRWSDVYFDGLEAHYLPPQGTDFRDFEIEVVYGVLVRRYEQGINSVKHFDEMEEFIDAMTPRIFDADEFLFREDDDFPWISTFLWASNLSIPNFVKERMEIVEQCHYWLQLLQGPGLPAVTPWNPMDIWRNPSGQWTAAHPPGRGLFWFDHRVENSYAGHILPFSDETAGLRPDDYFLWNHVMARDFVINAWLIDPATGDRIYRPYQDIDGEEVIGKALAFPDQPSIFQYSVESGLVSGDKVSVFNTMFNQNHRHEYLGEERNAFEDSVNELLAGAPDYDVIDANIMEMTRYRDMYDIGNPLQARLPSAFTVNLFVVSPPVTTGAATDRYTFSQTIHIPSGFLRRSQSVE